MATYRADPKILLKIHFGNPDLMNQFDGWFLETFSQPPFAAMPRDYGRHGRAGYLDVGDAEKVVEWLKSHGVEQM